MKSIKPIIFNLILTIIFCISGCYSKDYSHSSNGQASRAKLTSDYSSSDHSSTVCDPNNYDCNVFHEKILDYVKKLEPFYEKVISRKALSPNEAKTATEIVKEYYAFLINHKVAYGKLASDIVNDRGLFGQIANIHLQHSIKVEGHGDRAKNIEINLRVGLAYRDAKLRLKSGKFVSYRAIANYHYEMFEHEGLSKYAWGGTLLEEFAGSGSWMRLGGYHKTVEFSAIKLGKAIIFNKKVGDVNAREAFNSVKHLFLSDAGKSLRAVICGSWPVLCKML